MNICLLASLMAASMSVFAAIDHAPLQTPVDAKSYGKNSIVRTYSNAETLLAQPIAGERSIDYPTQIVRIQGDITEPNLSCDQVHARIEEFFSSNLNAKPFYYVTMTYCIYDENSHDALRYGVDSYFDPMTDQAIAFWEKWLSENNGVSLMGVPFVVEAAEGVALSLNLDAGLVKQNDDSVLTRYRHENASHYFPSHYDMITTLFQEVQQSFFSNDPEKILPFLHKWFMINNDRFYTGILRSSNYVGLQPERLFLMSKGSRIYTSPLRMYYAHHCEKYQNKHCL